MKKIISITIFCSLIVLFGCSKSQTDIAKSSNLPAKYIDSVFAFDVYDLGLLIGSTDYLFIGQVTEFIGTDYLKTTTGEVIGELPNSIYKVDVLENIKGDLRQDQEIEIRKYGGVNAEQTEYMIFEDDVMPEVGKKYIFVSITQEDGSNLVCGPNTTIPLEPVDTKKTRSALSSDTAIGEEAISIYKSAYENELPSALSKNETGGISNDDVSKQ